MSAMVPREIEDGARELFYAPRWALVALLAGAALTGSCLGEPLASDGIELNPLDR